MARARATARITGKGQVQVPQVVRQTIGADIGDDLIFVLTDEGKVVVEVLKRARLSELGGSLPTGHPFVGTDEEEAAVRDRVASRTARGEEA